MRFRLHSTVDLDYGAAATHDLLRNISGVAALADQLWTVSDEGRTLECLTADAGGYKLSRQIRLDDIIADIPGKDREEECDLEAIDIAGDKIWICGSHCHVRKKPSDGGRIETDIKNRLSRHLLGRLTYSAADHTIEHADTLPFSD